MSMNTSAWADRFLMVFDRQPYDLLIGVTGHRDIQADARSTVSASVEHVLQSCGREAKKRAVLSSLAEGADQLVAEIAIKVGYELIVPLPFACADYIAGFQEADKALFVRLISEAANVFEVPEVEQEGHGLSHRDWLYRQAGLYIANTCDVLLALWDGLPSHGSLCGTADVVEYVLCNSSDVLGESRICKKVTQVFTPRANGKALQFKAGTINTL